MTESNYDCFTMPSNNPGAIQAHLRELIATRRAQVAEVPAGNPAEAAAIKDALDRAEEATALATALSANRLTYEIGVILFQWIEVFLNHPQKLPEITLKAQRAVFKAFGQTMT